MGTTARAESAPTTSENHTRGDAAERRRNDELALAKSKPQAKAAMLMLLAALAQPTTPTSVLAAQSKNALRALRSLWEAAACVAEDE